MLFTLYVIVFYVFYVFYVPYVSYVIGSQPMLVGIKQSVSRAIAEKSRIIRLPVHIHDMMVSISKVERQFVVAHSRKPTSGKYVIVF
jgi:hypothetical protein